MTDLDRLWENYPTPPPPLSALLHKAQGAAGNPPRRRSRRIVLSGVVAAMIGCAFVAGTQVGREPMTPTIRTAAFKADLHPAASCDALLARYRERGEAQVTAIGWASAGYDRLHDLASPFLQSMARLAAGPRTPGAVGNSTTGTNVQEAGVDEPDVVKTDGAVLARINDGTLTLFDVRGAEVRQTADIVLPSLKRGEILLVGKDVIAIGSDAATPSSAASPGGRVVAVSIEDAAHPRITANSSYSAPIVSARQHGSAVRLVLSAAPPPLPFTHPETSEAMDEALVANRRTVRESKLSDWIPTVDDGNGPRPLIDCASVAIPPPGTALGTVGIVGFDVKAPTSRDAIGLAGRTDIAYESADHLYLAGGPTPARCPPGALCPTAVQGGVGPRPVPTDFKTSIFQFDLSGFRSMHVASGEVAGSIANRWSMDEAGGILRLAETQRGTSGQVSAVVTLRQDGTHLVENGRLDGLGAGETLTAARWFDDLAILSTAKQTDPLFTVDLSDPAKPKSLGALHISGLTDYFHPIGNGRLIGVGRTVSFAQSAEEVHAQVALFDISNLADVRQLDVSKLAASTYPSTAGDPRAFSWFADRSQAYTAMNNGDGTMFVAAFDVSGSTLTQRVIPVPGVPEKSDVRTLELPDRRVILVAGLSVTFIG